MKVVNFIIKVFGYVGIYFIALLESYLMALLVTSVPMALTYSVWSFFSPLPQLVAEKFGLLLLAVAVPLGIVFFIYTMINVHKK